MEKILKQVYGVELASQKVELALADDIQNGLKQYTSLKAGVDKTKNAAKNAVIKYSDSVKVAAQNAKTVIDDISKIEAKAKELGLGDVGYGGYKKEMVSRLGDYKSLISTIDKIYGSI